MSLEKTIEEIMKSSMKETNLLLQELINVLVEKKQAAVPVVAETPAVVEKQESKKSTKKQEPEKATATAEPEAPAIDYERDVKQLILEMCKKDREKGISLLAKFGAKNGKDLKPEQWPDFISQAKAMLSAVVEEMA